MHNSNYDDDDEGEEAVPLFHSLIPPHRIILHKKNMHTHVDLRRKKFMWSLYNIAVAFLKRAENWLLLVNVIILWHNLCS